MTIRHLQIFIEVCRKNSITAAAESLRISQPSVSQAILLMEKDYNVKLFDRIGNRLFLTDMGKRLLGYGTHITSLYSEMENSLLSKNASAVLKIGSSVTIGSCLLPGYLSTFERLHPDIEIHVQVENSAAVEKLILDNALDFALVEGIVSSPSIHSVPFLDDELVLVCGYGSQIWNKKNIDPSLLSTLHFILREPGSGSREIFEAAMLSQGLSFETGWQCNSTEAIKNAVKANLGVTVIARRLAQSEIDTGVLCEVPIQGVDFKRKFHLIHHKDKYLTPSAKLLMDFILSQNAPPM